MENDDFDPHRTAEHGRPGKKIEYDLYREKERIFYEVKNQSMMRSLIYMLTIFALFGFFANFFMIYMLFDLIREIKPILQSINK